MTPTELAAASSVCGSKSCDSQAVREIPSQAYAFFWAGCEASVSINTLASLPRFALRQRSRPQGRPRRRRDRLRSARRTLSRCSPWRGLTEPPRRANADRSRRALSPRPARSGRFRRRATSRGHRGDTTRRRTESRGHCGDHLLAHGPATPIRPRRRRPEEQSACCARCTSPRSHLSRKK